MSQIKDIMTIGCECIDEHETITAAARKMARLGVGALPIGSGSNHLKGIITDRDIAVGVVAAGKDPENTEVGEFASHSVVAVDAQDEVDRAIELMGSKRIRRLPVIDADSHLIGFLSQADIARNVEADKSGTLLERISAP